MLTPHAWEALETLHKAHKEGGRTAPQMPSIVKELIRLDFALAATEGWITITEKGIAALKDRPKA